MSTPEAVMIRPWTAQKYKGSCRFSGTVVYGRQKKSADAEYLDKQRALIRRLKLAKQQAKAGGAVASVAGAQGLARDPTGDAVEDEIDQNLDEMSRGWIIKVSGPGHARVGLLIKMWMLNTLRRPLNILITRWIRRIVKFKISCE